MKLILPALLTFIITLLAYILIDAWQLIPADTYKNAVVFAIGATIGMMLAILLIRKRQKPLQVD